MLDINDSVRELINNTPFSHFFFFPSCNISVTDLANLLNQCTIDNRFYLVDRLYSFTSDDVSNVLRIPNSGIRIDDSVGLTSDTILNTLFLHERPTRWRLETICERIKNNDLAVDDTTRAQLWLLVLFTTFLLPDSGAGVPQSILFYIEDLNRLHEYNWAEYIHRLIMSGVSSSRKYCLGCTWALVIWAYTKNKALQPPNPEEITPFNKWCKLPAHPGNILQHISVHKSVKCLSSPPRQTTRSNNTEERIKKLEEEIVNIRENYEMLLTNERKQHKECIDKYESKFDEMKIMMDELRSSLLTVHNELRTKSTAGVEIDSRDKKKKVSSSVEDIPLTKKSKEKVDDMDPSSLVKRIKKRTAAKQDEKNKNVEETQVKVPLVYKSKRKDKTYRQNTCMEIVCTPEQTIQHSSYNYDVNGVVCGYSDIVNLLSSKEINGALVDCYIEVIKGRCQLAGINDVFILTSTASQYIMGHVDDPEEVKKKALKRLDGLYRDVVANIETTPRILIPINKDFHWHLLEINIKEKYIYDYNSLLYRHDREMERWFDWWCTYINWKKLSVPCPEAWGMEIVQSFPQQAEDSLDCAIFMMKALECRVLDAPIGFTKLNMLQMRKEMAYDLLTLSVRTHCKKKASKIAKCKSIKSE